MRLKCLLSMTERQLKITSHIFTIYQNYQKTDFAKELEVSQPETYNPNSKDNKFEIKIIGKVLWNGSRGVI